MEHSVTLFVFIILRTCFAQYHFKNIEDREVCAQGDFVEISPYRLVSQVQMSWQSAHACCKMKGRVLHTIEKSVESAQYPLQKVLLKKLGMEAEDLQFWIGLSFHNNRFEWSFGSVFPQRHEKVFQEVYQWVEGHPELSAATRCVAISPYRNILEMRTVSCNLKLNFICQKILRMGGEPLSGQDMMEAGSAQFINIPGFDNLKFSTVYTRWPVANAICQMHNWALIDRVHERYGDGDKLAAAIGNSRYMFNKSSKALHTGGNDFCETHKWQWACGENLMGIIPWFENSTAQTPKKIKSNQNCLQYLLQHVTNIPSNLTLTANNVGCNEFGYTICDTTPSCNVNDQYRCLYKDPHFIDIESKAKLETENCRQSEFRQMKTLNRNGSTSYWVSLTKLTWLGANSCCKSKGWTSVAPKSIEEVEWLQQILCENEMCDGFWTSATTRGYLPHSPLRFPNGKLLSRSLYSLIRADGFAYPSCGRISFIDLQKSKARYVHSDCLENNFIVCQEHKEEHHILERRVLDDFGQEWVEVEPFEQSVFQEFLVPPNDEELDLRQRNYTRDFCPVVDIHQQYSENCPTSATVIDPTEDVFEVTQASDKVKIVISFQNRRILLDQLVSTAFYSTNDPRENSYAFQFLNTSVMLFSQLCPIVPHSFLMNSLKMFIRLHIILNPKRPPEIISKMNFDWAMKLLNVCDDYMKPVHVKHDNCGDLIVGEDNCTNFICTDAKFEFNLHKTDLLLDIIWKVFEVIHATCFPAFKLNPMLHHKYAIAITDLWESEEIRLRWSHQIEKKKFWKRFLGPYFEEHVLNMERCSTATIADSYFHVRLPRRSLPFSVRMTGFSYGES